MNEQIMNQQRGQAAQFQETRELSEIKGKMYLARQFPRDPEWCKQNMLTECQRVELAQSAQYEYPKGDTVVKGPSIRLVEVLARHWGNLDFGVNEIEAQNGSTLIKAFAWDLESNVYDEKTFNVKHERSTKKGTFKLTDERDIYEMVANKGARRKRACLLSVLPGWYVDAAIETCEATLKASLTQGKSMEEVRAAIVAAFAEFGITPEQIAEKTGRDVDKLTDNDVVKLRHLYSAIKDGFVKPADAFGLASAADSGLPSEDEENTLAKVNERLASEKKGRTDTSEAQDGTDKG